MQPDGERTGRARGRQLGYLDLQDMWRHRWRQVFPELLPDEYRIVRVGPSVDGINWQPSRTESSAMESLFPDGILACNRLGEVRFYSEYQLGQAFVQLPQSNSTQRDFDFEADDRIVRELRIPGVLRCMHFPEHLDHRQRQVVVGPKAAATKRMRARCWGLVGRFIDFVHWAFTGTDSKERANK